MKKILVLLFICPLISNAQLKNIFKKKTNTESRVSLGALGSMDIADGLKEALNKGITEQVSKLTQIDGFHKNDLVKIIMPEELVKVDNTLRKLGMASLADDGIKILNRAAEDAVKEATPVLVTAIKNIKIADAKAILMGDTNAATAYLETSTNKELYAKFIPIVQQSIGKVGADKIWNTIIQKYNAVPLVSKVNPDLSDYVANKSLEGVFKMIAIEEKEIRTNLNSRTSTVLKSIFALQDK